MGLNTKCAKCGCEDSFLTTPAPCPTPIACPTPPQCDFVSEAQCTIYTGDNILCDEVIVVPNDTNMDAAINNIVDYFCTQIANLPTTNVTAGFGINVTSTLVGTNTTYTITNTGLKKYAETFTTDLDGDVRTILGSDLANCNLLELDPCSKVILPGFTCDLNINVYYKAPLDTYWTLFPFVEPGNIGLSCEVNATTGDIRLVFNMPSKLNPVNVRVVVIG
jgi:hypothetical protein